jgi:hypothetical protein
MLSTYSEHYAWLLGDLRQVLRGDKKVCSYMQGRKGRNLEYLGVPRPAGEGMWAHDVGKLALAPQFKRSVAVSLRHIEGCCLQVWHPASTPFVRQHFLPTCPGR